MRVLITGGGGFVGSHLADAFIARGDDVSILDTGSVNKVRHLMGKPTFHYIRDSIFNLEILEGLIARADLVYHLAAVVGVEYYVGDPYEVLNVNVNGTQNVLKLAFKHGKKVVFGSTSEVYGRNAKVPWREDDDRVLGSTRIDRWCYSTSKAVGEHFCFAYHKMGLPVTITRYFNAYGPRLDKIDVGRIITIFMGQVLRNEPVTVIGDGTQTRCFTYIDDVVKATIAAGIAPDTDGGVFNIGTAVETPIVDLARTMIEIAGSSSTIKFVTQESVYGTSYEDIPRRVPDNTKMIGILGVKPEISLADGLRRTIDWFRTTPY
ncbi:MAG TPA: NAD-dependent epimerase/dehydratase family protein [Candidatus Binatia bacterium]|nr:NAD-dependent epimerase/dehydratase family protein [Candidatus Binatia bacterium]